jgi:spermidine/putrescine transport system permease protein
LLVWLWLLIFAIVPFGLIIIASFMSHTEHRLLELPVTLKAYFPLYNPLYLRIFVKSLWLAGLTTLCCLLLGYPFAFILAQTHRRFKSLLLLLVIIPFWTSSLIRSYALIAIIKGKGLLNTVLLALGLIQQPLPILFTNTAVLVGLVYNLLPFMVLPILTQIDRLDKGLIDAARDLGANWFTAFRKVIVPLTLPGILAGCMMVFLPAMTLFYIPDILGGAKAVLLGNLIQNQFLIAENWPLGSAISVVLTVMLAVFILLYLLLTRGTDRPDIK